MTPLPTTIVADAAERLDTLLPRLLGGSRSSWQQRIAAGLVQGNGQPLPKRHQTTPGEEIHVYRLPETTPVVAPQVFSLEILHEDDTCLVVNKPAGLLTHGAPSSPGETSVADMAAAAGLVQGDATGRGGVVHRLDRDTSGALLLARTRQAQAFYSEQFATRTVQKDYLALVAGAPQTATGRIEGAIGRGEHGGMALGGRAAREAASSYALVGSAGGASLLLVRLHTGRTHQIRVHLRAIGLPLVGDTLYTNKGAKALTEKLHLQRQWLHAWQLCLPGLGGHSVQARCPLPDDLLASLEQLGIAATTANIEAAQAQLAAMG